MTDVAPASKSLSNVWPNAVTFGERWVYDDIRLPANWWVNVKVEGSHHIWTGQLGYYPYALLARRVRQIAWHQVMTCVPLCGIKKCVNPEHLLLVLETE